MTHNGQKWGLAHDCLPTLSFKVLAIDNPLMRTDTKPLIRREEFSQEATPAASKPITTRPIQVLICTLPLISVITRTTKWLDGAPLALASTKR